MIPKEVLGCFSRMEGIPARLHMAWEHSPGEGRRWDAEEGGRCRRRSSLCGAGDLVPEGTSWAGCQGGPRRVEQVAEVGEGGKPRGVLRMRQFCSDCFHFQRGRQEGKVEDTSSRREQPSDW